MVRKCTRGRAPLPLPAAGGRATLQVLLLHAKEVSCAVKGVRHRTDRSHVHPRMGCRVGREARERHGREDRKARRWWVGKTHWKKMRSSSRLIYLPSLGGGASAVERRRQELVDQVISAARHKQKWGVRVSDSGD